MAKKKILLLGSTGKMGIALNDAFGKDYEVIGKNSKDFNAINPGEVNAIIAGCKPDIVINTVAFLGIDPCEAEPEKAFRINSLLPKYLAGLSNERDFLLIHFSTDAVFNDDKGSFYTEEDVPCPLNVYGFTKYGGDCFVRNIARRYYLFRISVLFGETNKDTQFVEKMLGKIRNGSKCLKISDDIISSPTYSRDVAREVKKVLEGGYKFGLYHIANEGKATLYELMREVIKNLELNIQVEPASFKDFPFTGIKNTFTPIKSLKLKALRPWQEAARDYCRNIKKSLQKD